MTDTRAIIRGSVSAEAALGQLASLTGSSAMRIETAQCFPYFSFTGRCSLPTIFGRKGMEIRCLVDAIGGYGATADRFQIDQVAFAEAKFLGEKISASDAARVAHRTATHTIGRNLRMIAQFGLEFEDAEIVYKKFWVVGDGNLTAIVDSTNGSMHPLHSRAA